MSDVSRPDKDVIILSDAELLYILYRHEQLFALVTVCLMTVLVGIEDICSQSCIFSLFSATSDICGEMFDDTVL